MDDLTDEQKARLLASLESAPMPDAAARMFEENLREGQEIRMRWEPPLIPFPSAYELHYDIRPLIDRQDVSAFRPLEAPAPSTMEDLGYAMARALGEAIKANPQPKLLTPLPWIVRARIAYASWLSRVATWFACHGMIRSARTLWWLSDRPNAVTRMRRKWRG